MKLTSLVAGAAVLSAVPALSAPLPVPLYSTDFETDQSTKWTSDSPTGTGVGFGGVNYNSTYDALDGRNGTGMKVSIKTASSPSGSAHYSATLKVAEALGGVPLSGEYRVNFDVYVSHLSPSGTGTTDFVSYSINRADNGIAPSLFAAPNSGLTFLRSTDGDVATDYRVYSPNSSDVLTSRFTSDVAKNSIGRRWETVELRFANNSVEWYQNGTLITTYTNDSDTSGTLTLGFYDTGSGSSSDPTQQYALFDNLVVSTVPEPTSIATLGLGALGLLRRRRR